MEFSRQGCWSGLPYPSPGDLPEPMSLLSPAFAGGSLPLVPLGQESWGTWAEQVASPGRRRMGLNIQMNRLVTVGSASVEYCNYLCCYYKWWKTEGGPVHTTYVHPEICHSSGAERQPPEGRPSPPSSSSPSFFLLIFFLSFFLFLCPLSPSPSSFLKKLFI